MVSKDLINVTLEPDRESGARAGFGAVERFASISNDGFAILDAERRFAYLNPAGARILRVDADRIVGQPALVFAPAVAPPGGGVRRSTSHVPGIDGPRLLEYQEERDGEEAFLVFADATERLRRERQLAAFAQTAATVAGAPGLDGVLDSVAGAVMGATGTAASTIVLYDERTQEFGQIGTAGGYPDDYAERLEGCRRRGAPLASLTAFASGKPFLSGDWAQRVLADSRWAPVHSVIRGRSWGALAAVPVMSREGAIGALTAFYPSGRTPSQADVEFLGSIASLVAVAVHNYRLLTELEAKAMVDERNRIARDLHDSVSQALFSLRLRSRAVWLANERDERSRERVRDGLEEIQELSGRALDEMRTLIFQLRPVELGEGGILGALTSYAAALSERDGLVIEVGGDPVLPVLGADAELHVLRIVQEALNNVAKHSGAGRASVAIGADRDAGLLTVLVADDGQGFEPGERPGHFGLRGMRERCGAMGGELEVASAPGATTVRATLPLDVVEARGGRTG